MAGQDAAPLSDHYDRLITAMLECRVVPFLGAGVNRCGRPDGACWDPEAANYVPDGWELTKDLAGHFRYPDPNSNSLDLLRVSQFVAVIEGTGPLYRRLRYVFDRDYPPTDLHRLLAQLPGLFRSKGYAPSYQLILTTNYDDVLERAFREQNEPFHLVTYISKGEHRGRFLHTNLDGRSKVIQVPNNYRDLSLQDATVIMKIHGAVERGDPDEPGHYVITEDDYVEYLTHTDLSKLVPAKLLAKLRHTALLFLGYGLRDWNLRAMLYRISREQDQSYTSWAIQLNPNELDRKFWKARDVEIFDIPLDEYVRELRSRLEALKPAPVRT